MIGGVFLILEFKYNDSPCDVMCRLRREPASKLRRQDGAPSG